MVTDANQRSESVPEAQDTAPELDAAGISDPLCNLATNKDSKGVQGKMAPNSCNNTMHTVHGTEQSSHYMYCGHTSQTTC